MFILIIISCITLVDEVSSTHHTEDVFKQSHFNEYQDNRIITNIVLDKPIYRPSEILYLTAFLFNAVTFIPYETQTGYVNIQVQIIDAKDIIIVDRNPKVHINNSIIGFQYKLPSTLKGGEYKIKIKYNDIYKATSLRKFQILAANTKTNPKIRKQIEFVKKTYSAGEECKVKILCIDCSNAVLITSITAKIDGHIIYNLRAHRSTPLNLTCDTDKNNNIQSVLINFKLPEIIHQGNGNIAVTYQQDSIVETLSKTIPITLNYLEINQYPESNDHLIPGLNNQRVYFEGFNPKTMEPADYKGEIICSPGEYIMSRVISNHEGRAVSNYFNVEKNKKYVFRLIYPSSCKGQIIELNTIRQPVGHSRCYTDRKAVLSSTQYAYGFNDEIDVKIQANINGIYKVKLFKRELLITYIVVNVTDTTQIYNITFNMKDLKYNHIGILRMTVYTDVYISELPIAERLIFRHPNTFVQFEMDVKVISDSDNDKELKPVMLQDKNATIISPFDDIEVSIYSYIVDLNNFTRSPIDIKANVFVTDDSLSSLIDTRLLPARLPSLVLFESEVYDLEDGNIYLPYDSMNHDKIKEANIYIDLLLGTQGWRRFIYHQRVSELYKEYSGDEFEKREGLLSPKRYGCEEGRRLNTIILVDTSCPMTYDECYRQQYLIAESIMRFRGCDTEIIYGKEYMKQRVGIIEFDDNFQSTANFASLDPKYNIVKLFGYPYNNCIYNQNKCMSDINENFLFCDTPCNINKRLYDLVMNRVNTICTNDHLNNRNGNPNINEALAQAYWYFSLTHNWHQQIIIFSNCASDQTKITDVCIIADELYHNRVYVDITMVNYPIGNTIPNPNTYISCLVEYDSFNIITYNNNTDEETVIQHIKDKVCSYPTAAPTSDPTNDPTADPTTDPTVNPTFEPTTDPTRDPTSDPTSDPTTDPTSEPTLAPTMNPTSAPSIAPSNAPSSAGNDVEVAEDIIVQQEMVNTQRSNTIAENEITYERIYAKKPRKISQKMCTDDIIRNDFESTIYVSRDIETICQQQYCKKSFRFGLSDVIGIYKVFIDGYSFNHVDKNIHFGSNMFNIQTELPLEIDAIMPSNLIAGDEPLVPVMIQTASKQDKIQINIDLNNNDSSITLKNNQSTQQTVSNITFLRTYLQLQTSHINNKINVTLSAKTDKYQDSIQKEITVVIGGFEQTISSSGLIDKHSDKQFQFELPFDYIDNTLKIDIKCYVSPIGQLNEAIKQLIREPHGCFEQTSSTTYPLVMALKYMNTHRSNISVSLIDKTKNMLRRGYKKLISFESHSGGFDWFGQSPGHEALTAYGVLEFAAMNSTDTDIPNLVDQTMLSRTIDWLLERKDNHGGYKRNKRSIGTFGAAPVDTTNAYITWSLMRSGLFKKEDIRLKKEIDALFELTRKTSDAYIIALGALTMFEIGNKKDGIQLLDRLVMIQDQFTGLVKKVKNTITNSGGKARDIEATALSALSFMASKNDSYGVNSRLAIEFLSSQCKNGAYSSTQATALSLEAIVEYDKFMSIQNQPGTLQLYIDNMLIDNISFVVDDSVLLFNMDKIGRFFEENNLKNSKHVIKLKLIQENESYASKLPYSIYISYNVANPQTNDKVSIDLKTQLMISSNSVKEGDVVTLNVELTNLKQDEHIPMVVVIIGIPGGLDLRIDQLRELKQGNVISFYETSPNELILYFRSIEKGKNLIIPIELLASIPGKYTGAASRAYLFYTSEYKSWADGITVNIEPNKELISGQDQIHYLFQ